MTAKALLAPSPFFLHFAERRNEAGCKCRWLAADQQPRPVTGFSGDNSPGSNDEQAPPPWIHMKRVFCFEPVEDTASTVLILGSMPGKVSLATVQYYAHPRNVFWAIMGELIGAHPGLSYQERLNILRCSGIALWDVLGSCVRPGSLDSDIKTDSAAPNDFKSFLMMHPNITRVFFNGAKAEQCFMRYVRPSLESAALQYQRLPSTSPANAGTSYAQKLLAWQSVIQGDS